MGERLTDVDPRGAERRRELVLAELGPGLEPLLADRGQDALNHGIIVDAARIDGIGLPGFWRGSLRLALEGAVSFHASFLQDSGVLPQPIFCTNQPR